MNDHTNTEVYSPAENRPLSDTVLNAINRQTGKNLQEGEFRLYDHIDPDGLDQLFRPHADERVTVMFSADDLLIIIYGNGQVRIHVENNGEPPPEESP